MIHADFARQTLTVASHCKFAFQKENQTGAKLVTSVKKERKTKNLQTGTALTGVRARGGGSQLQITHTR